MARKRRNIQELFFQKISIGEAVPFDFGTETGTTGFTGFPMKMKSAHNFAPKLDAVAPARDTFTLSFLTRFRQQLVEKQFKNGKV